MKEGCSINQFFDILADFLHKQKNTYPEVSDELIALARKHAVGGIVYYQTGDKRLLTDYSKAIFRQTNLTHLLKKVTDRMNAEGIEWYSVKGINVAKHYPVPAMRSMGDIDMIVHHEDRERVRCIMEDIGFENKISHDDHEWVFKFDNLEFEVHDALLYYDAANSEEEVQLMQQHWEYVSEHQLERNFHFIYLLVHLKKHFLYEGIGIRQFLDLAVEAEYGGLDWNEVFALAKEAGILRFCKVCLTLCRRWFGADVPVNEKLSDEFVEQATEKILGNGVFGFADKRNKDNYRLNMIRRNGRFRALIHSLFPSYKDCRYVTAYSWVNNRPWLLPAVWVFRFWRALRDKTMKKRGQNSLNEIVNVDLDERDLMLRQWGL